jgi:hypothetical protein
MIAARAAYSKVEEDTWQSSFVPAFHWIVVER